MNDSTLPAAPPAKVARPLTRSQAVAADITALLRARNALLWIVTREEARVERHIFEAAGAAGYMARTWDVAQGVCKITGERDQDITADAVDPGVCLGTILARSQDTEERCAWIMRDLPAWLVAGPAGAAVMRQCRNLARALPGVPKARAQTVIILSPTGDIPPELSGHATVIDWPMPDREEIASILDTTLSGVPEEMRATNGTRDAAIDSAVGLSGEEAASCYAKSLVQLRRIDPAAIANEKKRIVAREGVLEWIDPLPGGLESVGGLDVLKDWLVSRRLAYSAKARAYGLPAPKGTLIVGIPGGGKSLTAKAIATAWSVPLIRMDLGALKGKYVGESEAKFRRALATIDAIGRCVVWIDEIEKALAGAAGGASDGGVSQDQLGAILSWMQDRKGQSFVIATANDVSALPPELMRKGRFDELFFVDLPTLSERADILAVSLRQFKRTPTTGMLQDVAAATAGWTGAEIAALVPEAMFAAFADNAREIETRDLIDAARNVTPLSKTASEKIAKLRAWADGRARRASTGEASGAAKGRQLDI